MHLVSLAPRQAQHRFMHLMSQDRVELGLPSPGLIRDVHVVPQASERPPRRCLRHLSHRLDVALQAPQLEVVQLMPQRAVEPLRQFVRLVPFAEQVLVERDVQPPPDPRRRTQLQELLLCELSPEELLFVQLPQVPRLEFRRRRR